MDKWFKTRLRELVHTMYCEKYGCDEDLEEITTTGDVAGYNTPFAFKDTKKRRKKKQMKEALDSGDIKEIKILVRNVIADVLRDIWIKRTTWK